jgi:hypothetical protein
VAESEVLTKEAMLEIRRHYNGVTAAKDRLEFARTNGTFAEAVHAEQYLHNAAFRNWLYRHKMNKHEYYALMNREAAKRGLKPPFTSS